MVIRCEEVWPEISNYLENEVDPSLRATLEEHFRGCKHCTAVLDGTRNVIQLYGDERMIEMPIGFSHRPACILVPKNARCSARGRTLGLSR